MAYLQKAAARNAILLTLILDDTGNKKAEQIWDIYYHVMVDDESLNFLRDQASKLLSTAASAEEWNRGKYGATIRFCDSYTFSQVSKLWEAYALRPSDGQAFKGQQDKLRHGLRKARDIQNDLVGNATVYSGLRSAAPRADAALDDVDAAYKTFWKTGSSRQHQKEKPTNYNPMFSTIDPRYVLHYGTDPVIGYHLATKYIGLLGDSSLKPDEKKAKSMGACFTAAFGQFLEFMKAVQKSAEKLTMRFVITDALALCHTLQHVHAHKGSRSAGWYRGFRTWEPLVLDTDDYSSDCTKTAAPLLFDVIDTSNLADHLGCLNLLTGASPLLKPKPTSTLSTELLVKRQTNIDEYKTELLHGDIPTVALLLSISPVEIWTGTTAVSGFDERLVMEISGSKEAGQSRFVLHWKSTAAQNKRNQSCPILKSPLTFEPKQLAKLLFQMTQGMFQNENPVHWLNGTEHKLKMQAYSYYTRASFVAILGLIRRQSLIDWDSFMNELYDLITANMEEYNVSYMSEMIVYLDLLGLRPMLDIERITKSELSRTPCPLRHWTHVPSTICVTMVVPRKDLGAFKDMPIQHGSPIVQMVLRALDLGTQTYYMNIQAAFGHIKTVGDRYSENLALEVENDDAKWEGRAPLIVSATVPSSVALQKPDLSTEVIFALNHSPHAIANFASKLGLDLAVSRSTLAGDNVYITKHRPNMSTHVSFSGIAATSPVPEPVRDETQIQFHAQLTTDQSRLESIMAHVDIAPGELQDTLRSGAGIQVSQISTFEISISFTNGTQIKRVQFPIPISVTGGKTRIARKSSYVEYVALVPSQKDLSARPDSLYPVVQQEKGLLGLRTPHYVSLDQSPILGRQNSSQLSWLSPRLADVFSARERKTRETHMAAGINYGDTRIGFKDSLAALFSRSLGINGAERRDVFGLNVPQKGGVHAVIIVSSIRLDMSCQNVVMDAAVLPLSMDIMSEMIPIIASIQERGIVTVTVDEKELELWKHALPAMVERCRSWQHKPSCEYAKTGKMPISTEFAKEFLCSCGRGKFPPGYKVDLPTSLWTKASKHAVRAAISPCFSVPLIEPPFDMKDFGKLAEWRHSGRGIDIDAEITEKLDALRLQSGSCFRCKKHQDAVPGSLLRCGGCKVAEYCSKDCQRADWKQSHKSLCMLL